MLENKELTGFLK